MNVAELHVEPLTLQVFIKYLLIAADEMEKGVKDYRRAALSAPDSKKPNALREVLLAEQVERMMRSNHPILEFEDLRFRLKKTIILSERTQIVRRMITILVDEILRTQDASLAIPSAATRNLSQQST